MIDADTYAALSRFQAFQREMYEWETRYHPLMVENSIEYRDQAKAGLKKIFDEYIRNYREDYGRMSGPDTSSPPDHDPDHDIVDKVESRRTKVTVYIRKTTQFKETFRYTLGKYKEVWMIDKAEIYWQSEKKWGKFNL